MDPGNDDHLKMIIKSTDFTALNLNPDDLAFLRTQFVKKVQTQDAEYWIFRRSERANRLLGLKD